MEKINEEAEKPSIFLPKCEDPSSPTTIEAIEWARSDHTNVGHRSKCALRKLSDDVEKLQAECLKYREALEFYANAENYCCTLKTDQHGVPYDDLCPVLKDDGAKSREALKKEG